MMPLRAGSKSIPNKNFKKFRGDPLFIWNLTTLIRSKVCDYVFINSESPIYYEYMAVRCPKILWYERRAELAEDHVITIDVVIDFIDNLQLDNDDIFILTQATSPYLREQDIKTGLKHVPLYYKYDSMMSAGRIKRWLWWHDGRGMNMDKDKHIRRQDWLGSLIQNGCLYVTTVGMIRKTNMLWGGRLGFIEQPYWFELDEPADWAYGEALMGPPPEETPDEEIEKLYNMFGMEESKITRIKP